MPQRCSHSSSIPENSHQHNVADLDHVLAFLEDYQHLQNPHINSSIPAKLSHGQATPSQSQLVAISIMLGIPSFQIGVLHFDQFMRDGTILLVHGSLLADRVSFSLRDEVDPEVVVDGTGGDAGRVSVYVSAKTRFLKHLHSEASQAVGGVEEAHRTSGDTILWRNPRHDEQEDLDKDEQANRSVPCFEL